MLQAMSNELLSALILFAFVSSVTPGPNNLMLMASGANFGFSRTIPHMFGISVGFTLMIVLIGLGLIQVFDAYPVSNIILKIASVAYLLYLAWKIANAAAPGHDATGTKPMTFLQAAAFQWVNPKAWTMALTSISLYAPDQTVRSIFLVAAIFGAINLPTVSSWTFLGQQMRRLLTNPTHLRMFNWIMAASLVASLYPVVINH
jgi:threonine/homoserine/homoserine lactone efflux protein